MPRTYPSNAEAEATFGNGELQEKVKALFADGDATVTIMTWTSHKRMSPATMRAFAALAATIPGASISANGYAMEIVRDMTQTEAVEKVIGNRKSDMWYSKGSPHYVPESER